MSDIEMFQQKIMECEKEIGKGIIGQRDIIRQVMLALLTGGNVLLEGMPGLGKTMLVRTIGQVFLFESRLQPQTYRPAANTRRTRAQQIRNSAI